MKLSSNFTYEEFVDSATAKKYFIDNDIKKEQFKKNLRNLVDVLQKIRDKFGEPIIISSGYRCKELNMKLGGAINSDHMFASAADIHTKSDKKEDNKKLFDLICQMAKNGEIECRQILDEYGYNWIHVSINHPDNPKKKNQILHINK